MVKADGSLSRGRGLKPQHRILDGCKQCYYIHTIIKNKGSRMGHTKKNILKK